MVHWLLMGGLLHFIIIIIIVIIYCWPALRGGYALVADVAPSVVRRRLLTSKNDRGTAQQAVVINDQPVTPCLRDIDSHLSVSAANDLSQLVR